MINSLKIEYFLALAKYKNFSETARRLYVAQPAISKQIASLEKELNIPLFSRANGSVNLTEEGKIMQNAFEKILIIYENAKKDALQISEAASYEFHLAFVQVPNIDAVIVSSLNFIKHKFPNIKFIADCYSGPQLNNALNKNEVDLGITMEFNVKGYNAFDYELLYDIYPIIIVSSDHLLTQKDDLDYDLLKQQIFFTVDVGLSDYEIFCKTLIDSLGINPENIIAVPNFETLIHNVESGLGVALLSETPFINSNKNIKAFPFDQFGLFGIYAKWQHNNYSHVRDLLIKKIKEG